jgi:hypothetical protein
VPRNDGKSLLADCFLPPMTESLGMTDRTGDCFVPRNDGKSLLGDCYMGETVER